MKDVVPARFVHIDQSEYGAIEVLDDNIHPPELAEKLKKTRWGIINVHSLLPRPRTRVCANILKVWRPIKPVMRVRLYQVVSRWFQLTILSRIL